MIHLLSAAVAVGRAGSDRDYTHITQLVTAGKSLEKKGLPLSDRGPTMYLTGRDASVDQDFGHSFSPKAGGRNSVHIYS